jgi:hypothetical protein
MNMVVGCAFWLDYSSARTPDDQQFEIQTLPIDVVTGLDREIMVSESLAAASVRIFEPHMRLHL